MLILFLIGVQYSQNAIFSSEKGSNYQDHSAGSHHQVKALALRQLNPIHKKGS